MRLPYPQGGFLSIVHEIANPLRFAGAWRDVAPWSRLAPDSLVLRAPRAGVVVERRALPGAAVKKGAVLLSVADLSRVWIQTEVYERDLPRVRPGQRVHLESATLPEPLVGRVAAGSPVLAQENIENEYRVDPLLFSSRPHYLLRVEGNSMLNAGILDGDLLAVHRTPEAQNGQIVVARLDDEVTVKRFKRKGHQVSLLPENPEFQPIMVDLRRQELVIEGRAVGVIRPHLEN